MGGWAVEMLLLLPPISNCRASHSSDKLRALNAQLTLGLLVELDVELVELVELEREAVTQRASR